MSQLTPPIFPLAPREYDQDEERAFRARVADAIGLRLGKDEIPQYGGVPHAALIGTNAAFSTPGGGVTTILPFNVVLRDNPNLVVGTNFDLAYVMDLTLFTAIFHVSGAGGNTTLTLTLFHNGVPIGSTTRSVNLNDNEVYSSTFFAKDIPSTGILEIGISHVSAQALIVDMTKSRWWLEQLTPDPALAKLERF